MYTATNPYTSAGSVGGSGSFVGRDTLLRELVAALRRPERSAIMLSGGPGAGRTSALDELAALIEDEDGLGLAVRFDVQSRAFDSLDVVVVALAAAIADAAGVAAPELGQWAEQGFTESWLPWVLDRLPQGQRLVLLIDEFVIVDDSRLRQASGALLPMLGGLIEQHGPELAVVLATDLRNTAAEVAVRKHLPGVMRRQLGVLAEAQAWALVRMSQVDRTLMWTIGAVEAVLERSGGHPAVTQTLCEIVWDRACSSRTAPGPAGATVAMVQAAVPPAMELLSGVFNAMWGGLPAAGRVAAGLLAWSDRSAVSLAELADLLRARGLRNVGRELTEDAARELRRQGVLAADGEAIYFVVPLFRVWVRENKPLDDILSNLDGVMPLADERYRAAAVRWQAARSPAARREAVEALKAVLDLNPDHTGAIEMLAAVCLRDRELAAALPWLERLHPLRPDRAGPYLTRVLLELAEQTVELDARLRYYDRVLEVAPEQAEAKRLRGRLLEDRAAMAASARLGTGDHASSSDLPTGAPLVQRTVRSAEVDRRAPPAPDPRDELIGALTAARRAELDGSEADRMERQARLAVDYERGLAALERGDRDAAIDALSTITAINPGFREVTRYLHLAVTGQDAAALAERSKHVVPTALFGSTLALAAAFAFAWVLGVPAPGRVAEVEAQSDALQVSIPQAAAAERPAAPRSAGAPVASPDAAAAQPEPEQLAAPEGPSGAEADAAPARAGQGDGLAIDAPQPPSGSPLTAGWAAIHRRELDEAQRQFERAVRDRPSSPDAWYGAAYVAEMRGDRAQAVQGYCKAKALGGDRAELLADVAARLRVLKTRCY